MNCQQYDWDKYQSDAESCLTNTEVANCLRNLCNQQAADRGNNWRDAHPPQSQSVSRKGNGQRIS